MAQGTGHPGDGPGGATEDAYVPRMVNLGYTPGEGSNSFPEPGWEGRAHETGVFHESPGGFADPFSDDDGGVRSMSQEQAYTNPELQEKIQKIIIDQISLSNQSMKVNCYRKCSKVK